LELVRKVSTMFVNLVIVSTAVAVGVVVIAIAVTFARSAVVADPGEDALAGMPSGEPRWPDPEDDVRLSARRRGRDLYGTVDELRRSLDDPPEVRVARSPRGSRARALAGERRSSGRV
jgi:hypothetical protein